MSESKKTKLGIFVQPGFHSALSKLAAAGQRGQLRSTVARLLHKHVVFAEQEAKYAEQQRKTLLDELATKGEDGKPQMTEEGNYSLTQEAIAEFSKRFNEVLLADIDDTPKAIDIAEVDQLTIEDGRHLSMEELDWLVAALVISD